MTLRDAATELGVTVKTVRNLLSRARAGFDIPRYDGGANGIRRRLLTRAEVDQLAALLGQWRRVSPEVVAHSAAPLASSSGSTRAPRAARDMRDTTSRAAGRRRDS